VGVVLRYIRNQKRRSKKTEYLKRGVKENKSNNNSVKWDFGILTSGYFRGKREKAKNVGGEEQRQVYKKTKEDFLFCGNKKRLMQARKRNRSFRSM